MIKPVNKPLITTIASVGAIVAASLIGGVAVFLLGVPEVRAEALDKAAVHRLQAKGDRLPVLVKGTACSAQGWPHYEQGCQFDMRRPADEVRTVRIVALR
jgi:hypothetical protein